MGVPVKGQRVLVAMSGGVDSSVAAALLHEQGYDVVGVTLHLWDAEGESKVGRCCAPEDREDARLACEAIGISHYVFDEREAFRKEVVNPFVDTYLAGATPSPCVECNRSVKLGRFGRIADALGASHIATGHYARLLYDDSGRVRLLRGRDHDKDQSYFLYGVAPAILERMVFPLGDYTKDEVRAHGRRLGVPNSDKPDSQELCFVPDGKIGAFVKREADSSKLRPGVLRDESGEVLAEHDGVHQFTIGQRKGLGIGGGSTKYVLKILPEAGEVVVGGEESLRATELVARNVTWTMPTPREPFAANVRVRYRHTPAKGVVEATPDGFVVRFGEGQRAITPGQVAVLYTDEDEVIAGGVIVS